MMNSNISMRRGGDVIPPRARHQSSGSSSILLRLCSISLLILVGGFYALSFRFLLNDAALIATNAKPSSLPVLSTTNNKNKQQITEPASGAEPVPPVIIAHAVSLIKCSKGSSVTGFLDAAAILRHSIHKNSIHYHSFPSSSSQSNINSTILKNYHHPTTTSPSASRYSYQMYAIVHTSCAEHATILAQLGYTILIKDHPVRKEDIKGEWLRNHIESENCCGSAEFIKLYGK
jgi:hypothetical protein